MTALTFFFLLQRRSAPVRLCLLKWKYIREGAPVARVYCHTSLHLALWTVRNVSLRLPPDTFICQTEIINTIISPMLALYSVNCFKMWLCLFISAAWISERPLICLFHYTLALCTAWACKELRVLPGLRSDVRFVRQQRYVTMSAWKKKGTSFWGIILCFLHVLYQTSGAA